jgi:aspartate/methionine/tyrosine aminotransferase
MNKIAESLNTTLGNSAAYRLLSRLGRELYFPKGIVYQSAEAGQKAKRHNATIGISCEATKPMMLEAVHKQVPGLSSAEAVSYAPPTGVEELRKLWKAEMLAKNPGLAAVRFSLPVVVPGLTPGISLAADLFVDARTPVIIPDMYWDNYSLIFETRLETRVHTFPMFNSSGLFNAEGLERTLQSLRPAGKAALVLNFPNNPTGYTPSVVEQRAIVAALVEAAEAGMDILAICDDAYYGLFYEKTCAIESIFTMLSSAHPNILAAKVDGSTKEDFVWGFRVAFLTFGGKGLQDEQYEALNQKAAGGLRSTISNSSRLAQSIMINAMKNPAYQQQKREKLAILTARYERVKEILARRSTGRALKALPFNSGYFMCFRCEGLSAEALRQALLAKGIGTISLEDTWLRVAFASIDIGNLEELYTEIFRTADELGGR